jgi:hypothetical protein
MNLEELLAHIEVLPIPERLHLLARVSEDLATELRAVGEADEAGQRVQSFADLYGIARGAEVSDEEIEEAQRAVSEVDLERFKDI